MRNSQFDPFGEPSSQRLADVAGGSRLAQRAGVGLFWGLVVTIVVARAALFDAGLEDQLRYAASVARSVIAALV